MVGTFLVRGMLVGIVAGLLAFGFAKIFGEPQIDRAIAFEEQMEKAKSETKSEAEGAKAPAEAPATPAPMKGMDMGQGNLGQGKPAGAPASEAQAYDPELVSRAVQSTIGLLTGVVVYSTAFGGLFALVFAFVYGRVGRLGPRATAALLAAAGYVAIVLVPMLKYPANPPSIGEPGTIGYRSALFLAMLVISIAALGFAVTLGRRLLASQGAWNATVIAAAVFVVIIAACQIVMPTIDEVPEGFSATLLWRFRLSSLGTQAVMWATIGLVFGALTERSLAPRQERGVAFTRPARG
jgi:predicted cobalt transporter CbtA